MAACSAARQPHAVDDDVFRRPAASRRGRRRGSGCGRRRRRTAPGCAARHRDGGAVAARGVGDGRQRHGVDLRRGVAVAARMAKRSDSVATRLPSSPSPASARRRDLGADHDDAAHLGVGDVVGVGGDGQAGAVGEQRRAGGLGVGGVGGGDQADVVLQVDQGEHALDHPDAGLGGGVGDGGEDRRPRVAHQGVRGGAGVGAGDEMTGTVPAGPDASKRRVSSWSPPEPSSGTVSTATPSPSADRVAPVSGCEAEEESSASTQEAREPSCRAGFACWRPAQRMIGLARTRATGAVGSSAAGAEAASSSAAASSKEPRISATGTSAAVMPATAAVPGMMQTSSAS